jgi:hypothetical protein
VIKGSTTWSNALANRLGENFGLIEAVEAEGFGGGGVVAAAFGDVQVGNSGTRRSTAASGEQA